jgi:hypothetical protein
VMDGLVEGRNGGREGGRCLTGDKHFAFQKPQYEGPGVKQS